MGKILKRDEFEHFIESHDLISAIKSIAYKPIGSYLGKLTVIGISLENIDKVLEEYTRDTLLFVYDNTPTHHKQVLYDIEKPYDLMNLSIMYSSLREGNKAVPVFPAGTIYVGGKKVEDEKDILEIVRELGLTQKLEAHIIEQARPEVLILKGFEVLQKIYFKLKDNVLKRIYGLIYDYALVRSISALGREYVEQISVNPILISREVIDLIGREKVSYESIIESVVKHDDILKSIYSDVSMLARGFTALDYTHAINMLVSSSNTIMPGTPHPYIRALLLVRAESIFMRLSILALLGYVEKDLVKNIINRWWIK
ncbi:hypothetical protein J4526_01080 [Desulfurococcaceae archaeon MEX13E-LK6-19]|nr:hypothetical protein J4526_01080 [Desulfurococcaceae archaeon MEX13E-LK6-19]